MLRTPVYKNDEIDVGDPVEIWRDASGWLFPSRVTEVTPHYYEVAPSNRLKTSGINRTRLIKNRDQYINYDDRNARDESVANTTAAEVDAQQRRGLRVTMAIPRAKARCVIKQAQGILSRPLHSTRSQTSTTTL